MKKTKMQMSKKLNLNKNQITALSTDQAHTIAGGGGGGTSKLITFNALCNLNVSNTCPTRMMSYCGVCTAA